MSRFTYIDLFAGVGGFRQALDGLGGTCVFTSEIDKFAVKAYAALYGDGNIHGDITKIDAREIPYHDLIVAGIPCQAFSVAGKRKGFEDTRGTLFFDVARIAKEKRPKAVLIENVKGLVNHDEGRTLDVMIETLNDIGYIVDFNVLNSKYFGVPQNRERIFIVAVRSDLIEAEPFSEESTKGQTIVPKGKRRIGEWAKTFNFVFPEQSEVTTRLRDILETEVDEKYYLSDDKTATLVAQLEAKEPNEVRATALQNANMQGRRIKENDEPSFTVSATDRHGVTLSDPQMLGLCDFKGNDAIRRVYSPTGVSPTGVSPTLTTMQGGHQEPKIAEAQEIANGGNISYCIDANYAKGISPGSIGKGRRTHVEEVRPVLTPDRVEKRQNGRRFKEDGEESFTLTAQDKHGVALGSKPRYRIRKLTPLECFRLQGFPDSAHQTLVDAGISDSQRYKMAGNAVTVNVIKAIGRRLIPLLNA